MQRLPTADPPTPQPPHARSSPAQGADRIWSRASGLASTRRRISISASTTRGSAGELSTGKLSLQHDERVRGFSASRRAIVSASARTSAIGRTASDTPRSRSSRPVYRSADVHHLGRERTAELLPQDERGAQAGREPVIHEVRAVGALFRQHDHVGVEPETEASTHRLALHGGDDRHLAAQEAPAEEREIRGGRAPVRSVEEPRFGAPLRNTSSRPVSTTTLISTSGDFLETREQRAAKPSERAFSRAGS